MEKRVAVRWCLTVGALCLVVGGFAVATGHAQVLYGSIVGTVRDGSGGVLPGATVVVTNIATKATRETVTDAAGAYHFPNLQSGTYPVAVNVTGFRTFTRADVPVTLNTAARVDASLSVGGLEENVVVSAERPVLQTETAAWSVTTSRRT